MTIPESFKRQLDARMSAPTLLDPRAVDGVYSLSFDAATEEGAAAYFGDAEGAYFVGDDGVARVRVEGPLAQRAWSCWVFGGDGYDAIESRVRAALNDPRSRSLVIEYDSPGGEVAGCGVCADAIRAMSVATRKPVVAYVNELAASAAYWLASAADKIVMPASAIAGSIGVITTRVEDAGAAGAGRKVHFITSGARKADGHPTTAMSDEERAAIQSRVDALADVFAGAVAERRGMKLADVRGLEAAVFVGQQAINAGLADQITDLPGAIALAASLAASTQQQGQQTMKILLAAMGLDASASEAEAVAKYTADNVARGADVARVLTALDAKSTDEAVAKAHAYKADAAEVASIRAQRAEELKANAARARVEALDEAVASGRMSPAERAEYDANPALAAIGADVIRASIKHRAPIVADKPIAAPSPDAVASTLTPVERELCKSAGISEADYIKQRAASARVED